MLIFPFHRVTLKSNYSPPIIKNRIERMIKKPSNKKFEIVIYGEGIGIEEFDGYVSETDFRLTRVKNVFHRNSFYIIYEGHIEKTQDCTQVNITFRFDYFVIAVLFLFLLAALLTIIVSLVELKISNKIALGIIVPIFYAILMLGFNYRVSCVKELLSKKLKCY